MVIEPRSRFDWAGRIGRRIRLRDLHVLMAVVQWGSMARAAEHLAVSQPVISKTIAELEHTLGVRLLDRDRHGAVPTVYGEALLKRSVAAFEELRQGVKDIDFLLDATGGELRIAAADPIASGLIPAIIESLSLRHPGITYHVTGGASVLQQQIIALRDRRIDLIIGRLPHVVAEPDLQVDILGDEPSLVAAGAENPWVGRRRIKLADLVEEHWVLPAAESFVGSLIAELFHASGHALPRKAVYCTSIQMNNALLATGRYLAFYPGSVLRFHSERLALKVLDVELSVPSTPLGIISLKARTLPPVATLFVEYAHEIAAAAVSARKC
jgi:DNA-binding transcriptional LysR family regulator